jgi:hypothetical protein
MTRTAAIPTKTTQISSHTLLCSSVLCSVIAVVSYGCTTPDDDSFNLAKTCCYHLSSIWVVTFWSIAQWIPSRIYDCHEMNEIAWKFWEDQNHRRHLSDSNDQFSKPENIQTYIEEIPVIYIQDHDANDLLPYLEKVYGKDWMKRPLLLKGLWSNDDLLGTSNRSPTINKNHGASDSFIQQSQRRLSLDGLLQENLTVPYFTDARTIGALSPDGIAPIRDIVFNISKHGAPHKIATQLLIQKYPELISEVAPLHIVTQLFGRYFSPDAIRGSGPFHLLPALTTVPLFVATSNTIDNNATAGTADAFPPPHTALHCEPIGNVAVQLCGQKQWTLVRPEFSYLLRPIIAPDGRAFFASWLSHPSTSESANVRSTSSRDKSASPFYHAITEAGDAMWVPTWTWHRVDYIMTTQSSFKDTGNDINIQNESQYQQPEIAIGASLFHFRPMDFFMNNPLFAVLIVPAIILELIGYKTQ